MLMRSFNSLSRDHVFGFCADKFFLFDFLSTPSLGITKRDEVRIVFISDVHVFQLPLSGSQLSALMTLISAR